MMQTHRFYLPPGRCTGEQLHLDEREAHHALRVLRLNVGDEAVVLDGAGNELMCVVETARRDAFALSVRQRKFAAPPPAGITLLVGIPRGKIIDNIIQKSVELGVGRIVPLLAERVVTHLDDEGTGHKRDKWQQVAIEAIKQCGAAWLPRVEAPMKISEFLAGTDKFELSLVGSLQPERRHPREIFAEFEKANGRRPKSLAVWIGPEGDFTPEELQAIRNAGAHPVTLGPLVLRVETAAIYCLSFLNYELNR